MVMQPLYVPLVRKFEKRPVDTTPQSPSSTVDRLGLDGAIDQEVPLPDLVAPLVVPEGFATVGVVDGVLERMPPRVAKLVVPRVRGPEKKLMATERRGKKKAKSVGADQIIVVPSKGDSLGLRPGRNMDAADAGGTSRVISDRIPSVLRVDGKDVIDLTAEYTTQRRLPIGRWSWLLQGHGLGNWIGTRHGVRGSFCLLRHTLPRKCSSASPAVFCP